ncbi:MAG: hypothetical protein QXK78_07505 [Candidatus Bathyarchaeia archaeon]
MKEGSTRLQYSGFVIFVAKMLSLGTGLAFQLMVARVVTAEEYGIWFNVNDLVTYFTIFAGVLPFWAMRFASRGAEGAIKTGVITNFSLSVVAASIYAVIISLVLPTLGVEKYLLVYTLGAIQIIECFLISALEEFLRARRPQTIGYGLLMSELFKVFLGYIMIFRLGEALRGAIISIISAVAIQLMYYFIMLRGDLREKIRIDYVKEWIKGSILNVYSIIGAQINNLIFILLFVYGGEEARGYYGAAAQIATVITYSSFLAFALYPKLLSGGSTREITQSLKTVLMFALPMTIGVFAMSDSYLLMLKSEYREAQPVLVVLAVDAFLATLSNFLSFILYGLEKVDEKWQIPLSELIRSRIFLGFSLVYLQASITVPTTLFILTSYVRGQKLQSALMVAIINTIARFVIFATLCIIVNRMAAINIPWRNTLRYFFASIVMAFFLRLIPHPERLHQILILTLLGGLMYVSIVSIIDEEAKTLFKRALYEIRVKLHECLMYFPKLVK